MSVDNLMLVCGRCVNCVTQLIVNCDSIGSE